MTSVLFNVTFHHLTFVVGISTQLEDTGIRRSRIRTSGERADKQRGKKAHTHRNKMSCIVTVNYI